MQESRELKLYHETTDFQPDVRMRYLLPDVLFHGGLGTSPALLERKVPQALAGSAERSDTGHLAYVTIQYHVLLSRAS
jgi:hypothetical protein